MANNFNTNVSNQIERMKEMMNYGLKTENKQPYRSVEYERLGADGKTYGIIREGSKYHIKVSAKRKPLKEDYDYIGGFQNHKTHEYNSYANALKQFDLKMNSLNEAYNKKAASVDSWNVDGRNEILAEASDKMKKEIARQREIMSNATNIFEGKKSDCGNKECKDALEKPNFKMEKPTTGDAKHVGGDFYTQGLPTDEAMENLKDAQKGSLKGKTKPVVGGALKENAGIVKGCQKVATHFPEPLKFFSPVNQVLGDDPEEAQKAGVKESRLNENPAAAAAAVPGLGDAVSKQVDNAGKMQQKGMKTAALGAGGTLAGAGIGGLLGGPAGALAGAAIGGGAGAITGGLTSDANDERERSEDPRTIKEDSDAVGNISDSVSDLQEDDDFEDDFDVEDDDVSIEDDEIETDEDDDFDEEEFDLEDDELEDFDDEEEVVADEEDFEEDETAELKAEIESLRNTIDAIASKLGVSEFDEDEPLYPEDEESYDDIDSDEDEFEVEISNDETGNDEEGFEDDEDIEVYESRNYRKLMEGSRMDKAKKGLKNLTKKAKKYLAPSPEEIEDEDRNSPDSAWTHALKETELHVWGKHPRYQKEPFTYPNPKQDKTQGQWEAGDENSPSKGKVPYAKRIGDSTPYDKEKVKTAANSIAESIVRKLLKNF